MALHDIANEAGTGETLLRFRDDEPHDEPAVTLESFLGQSNATAVRIEAGEDARALLGNLDRIALIEIGFPTFRDGRGYSAARVLREAGYTGELRAEGDVLVDQLPLMRRCGFDSFAPAAAIDAAVLDRALTRYQNVYQSAADGRAPVWKLRHG
ncbi:DUF934 domain-containing protein [Sphingomonas qomolangmaensis]|uniref:DUF934 domain-containing protein n=1 Tax=Sphingomonas qomolangmaensis TaxID=2918765 RepID=A0ABY5L8J9_9SPHN|nr:DUF934 domain-containing protein [Sphingomonas qomolangmaensis]UUL83112.1 DUF934 domain-containing protein [Sphingomonas qomolangmaensis]